MQTQIINNKQNSSKRYFKLNLSLRKNKNKKTHTTCRGKEGKYVR